MSGYLKELDKWVSLNGNGKYDGDEEYTAHHMGTNPIAGIQQNRNEISDFIEVLSKKNYKSILEIGLGYYGSTHFLWRMLFEKVITIEINNDRIQQFGLNTMKYYGDWILDDGKSYFINGDSNSPNTINNLYNLVDEIDVLFIDAMHTYPSVLSDWIIYSKRVRKGGMIVFHDICKVYPFKGVQEFVKDLEQGKIDGKARNINKIIHTNTQGIGWYEK
jgi:predicted O-methyltransferase YrrM